MISDEIPPDSSSPVGRITSKDFLTDPSYKMCYDMSKAPIGVTLLLLSHPAGITHKAKLTGRAEKDKDIVAWCGLPDRDKEEEARLGLFSHNYKPQSS